MKKYNLLITLFIIASINCFGQEQGHEKKLDSIFSILAAQNQFSGVALIAEQGKIKFEKGYGYSNENTKQLNNTQTIFEIGSSSKQFTGAAIVLLKRMGKLNYEDSISKYLPELSFWKNVTIYDLLRHTSGIPEYLADMPKDWDHSKIATNKDVIAYYAARKDTLQFAPRSRYRYCNTNYTLLASIIERLSGEEYSIFLSQNIFKPLKMNNTFVYNRREKPKNIKNYATGYVWAKNSFNKVTSEHPGYNDSSVYYLDGIVGSAKINSTVEDMYKWVTALKNNTLFTQNEFDEMMEVTKTSAGKDIAYGFGFDVSKGKGKFSFGHTGSWDGYISFIYCNAIKDRTIIILENFKLGVFPFDNITQILDNDTIELTYRKKISMPQVHLEKYAGTYFDSTDKSDAYVISYIDGHLIYNTTKIKYDMRFFPVSPNEFQGMMLGGANGVLRFINTESGTIKMEMLQAGKIIGSGIRNK